MSSTPAKACHILVVEDEDPIITLLQLLLEMRGYSSTAVTDGEEALHYLREAAALPSLILLDLQMPGMDGRTFLEILQATPEWQAIPVVLLSASQDVAAVQQQHAAEAAIRKPFDPDQMLDLVEQLCS